MSKRQAVIDCLTKEIENRADFFEDERLETIYIGGGTPSLLSSSELAQIFNALRSHYDLGSVKEITIECNPDDLSKEKLASLKRLEINRLSIGIQSFNDADLALMNRAHNGEMSTSAIKNAKAAGFDNITVDLIYGIPGRSTDDLKKYINRIAGLEIPHFSAYALTVEPRTLLAHQVKKGKVQMPTDEAYREQFMALIDYATEMGYTQYELSNFCRPNFISIHNSNYWEGKSYLGIGPSAHSYKQGSRRMNVANNSRYINESHNSTGWFSTEQLSTRDMYNELLMVRLRTSKGINLNALQEAFGLQRKKRLSQAIGALDPDNKLFKGDNDYISLTNEGMFISDHLISQLMEVD